MRDEKKLWIIRGVVAAIGLGLLAPAWKDILLGYGWSGPWSESVGGLLRGIGEAVVVALVLEWLVDAPAKQRLMGETMHATIIQAASKFLADKLSDQIFQYIEEKLLRIKLVRRSWNITYRISMVPGHNDDYVKLETESEYKMANTAPSQTTYDAVYRVEKSLVPVGTTSIDEVTVRNLLQIPPHDPVFHYPDTTNKAEDVPQPDEDSIVFKKAFQIPVHTATSAFQFVFKSTEYFHVGSIAPFFAKYPVEQTTLKVFYPNACLDIIVDFPANGVAQLAPEKGNTAGERKYVFPIPILPGQGFTVRFPKVQ